jgi:multiple sugar transport system substrate-binding protein
MKSWSGAHGLRRAVIAITVVSLFGAAACGGGSGDGQGPAASEDAGATASLEGVDDGTKLSLWTRAPLEAQAKALVQAYNSTHKTRSS